jgi:hypothetical protein
MIWGLVTQSSLKRRGEELQTKKISPKKGKKSEIKGGTHLFSTEDCQKKRNISPKSGIKGPRSAGKGFKRNF